MKFKYNLKKIMTEKNYSLNRLARESELNIKTVRGIRDSTNQKPRIDTLKALANVLECDLKDLIEDADWLSYYNYVLHEYKDNAAYKTGQYFSVDNINLLQKSITKLGIITDITPSSRLLTLTIKNRPAICPVYLDINLRINSRFALLEIIDFYVFINSDIIKESGIKNSIVGVIEHFAKVNNIERITFYNSFSGDPEYYDYPCEEYVIETIYSYDSAPDININVLKERGYKNYKELYPIIEEIDVLSNMMEVWEIEL